MCVARSEIDAGNTHHPCGRRRYLLERNLVPPNGRIGRILEIELQFHGGGTLRRRRFDPYACPLTRPFASVDIIRLAGTVSVSFFPIEPRDNLAPLVLQTIGAVICDEPI